MANEVEIIIKAVDQASAVLKGMQDNLIKTGQSGSTFGKVMTGINNSMPAIIGGVAALAAGVKAVTGKFDQATEQLAGYTRQVRELSMTIGATPEEASKLIQVADDMEVEFGQLEIAMKRAIQKGLSPTIEGIGQLSDEYLALAPGIERTKFLMDTFGRSGADVARLMELGSQKIKEMGDSVSNTALIINEQGIKAYQDYYEATDRLGDATTQVSNSIGAAWMAIKTSAANAIAPLVEGVAKAVSFEDALKNAYKQGYISLEAYDRLFTYSWHNQEEGFIQLNAIIETYKKAQAASTKEQEKSTDAIDKNTWAIKKYTDVYEIAAATLHATTGELGYFNQAEEIAMQTALMGTGITEKFAYSLDTLQQNLIDVADAMGIGISRAMGWTKSQEDASDAIAKSNKRLEQQRQDIDDWSARVAEALKISFRDLDLGLADAIMREVEQAEAVLKSPQLLSLMKRWKELQLVDPKNQQDLEKLTNQMKALALQFLIAEHNAGILSDADFAQKLKEQFGIAASEAERYLKDLQDINYELSLLDGSIVTFTIYGQVIYPNGPPALPSGSGDATTPMPGNWYPWGGSGTTTKTSTTGSVNNNYNLTVVSSAPVEPLIADFTLLKTMAGAM